MQELSTAFNANSSADVQGRGHPRGAHPFMVLLLVWCLLGGCGWWLLSVNYNPSHGAQGDFEKYHLVTVQQYVQLPWRAFLREMLTASGPLFYAVLGALRLDQADLARPAVLLMHLGSTGLLGVLALRSCLGLMASCVLMGAFFFSPFQLGPALWGHPEALAMLMMVGSTVWCVVAHGPQGRVAQAVWLLLLPLTVAVRQTCLAIVAAQMLGAVQQRRYRSALVQGGLSMVVLVALAMSWGSLTPPAFHDHLQPSLRTGLVALTMLLAVLMAGAARGALRPSLGMLGRRWLCILPVVVILYSLSAPFERGGFVFSRLDALDRGWLGLGGVVVLSPVLMAVVMAWCWDVVRANALLSLQVLCGSLVLAASNVLYVKYVDFFFWPLLCMALVRADASGRKVLVYSAAGWTVIHLLLVSITYRT